ncbi:MAG: GIY-YIG nuclease family protein [Candidatus Babeliales bacterium]
MYYVYIIQSINHPDQIYVGCTQDLKKRLANHNCGTTSHTNKFKPWKLTVYIAFDKKDKAYNFEAYLKSGTGRAFRDKRLL